MQIDDKKIRKIDDILTYLEREKEVGDIVQLTILRDGKTEKVPVTLGARPTSEEFSNLQTPPRSENEAPERIPEELPYNDLYNECLKLAGNDICNFLFRR